MPDKNSVQNILDTGVKDGLFNRAVVGVTRNGAPREYVTVSENLSSGERKIDQMSIFDIASITKFILSILFHRLCFVTSQAGSPAYGLDTLVNSLMPISGPKSDSLKMWQLLNFHAEFLSGHPTQKFAKEFGTKGLLTTLKESGFKDAEFGEVMKYGNTHSILLGLVLEAFHGKTLESLMQKYLFTPLGMKDTTPMPNGKLDRCVQSAVDVRLGQINDPTARIAYSEGRLIGSAGLFSTADDLLRLLELILNKGVHYPWFDGKSQEGVQFLEESTVTSLHIGKTPIFGNGVGKWNMYRQNLETYTPSVETGIHKLGHTGCIVVVFPEHNVAFVIFTDFLSISRSPEEETAARRKLYILFAEIGRCVAEASQK